MPWPQVYDPTGSAVLSTLLAALPIVVLLGALGLLGWPAPRAAFAGLTTALGVAILVFGMPWRPALAAAGYGAAVGLFPIGWIVLGAVFLYALTVETGEFEKVKWSVASLSPDRRIQALLIAFSFGAFLEGAAGFGTPVAISAALMIGAGFKPLHAAGLALIANTAPVAFGALGTPIHTLADVTQLPEMQLSRMAGRQLPFFSLIIPAWMVVVMSGWSGLRGVWPAVVVSGTSFALMQYVISNFLGPTLVDVGGGLVSLVLLTLFLRVWQPAQIWRFEDETEGNISNAPASPGETERAPDSRATKSASRGAPLPQFTRRQVVSAWVPWIILSVCVLVWGIPPIQAWLDGGRTLRPSRATAPEEEHHPLNWWERPNVFAGRTLWNFSVPYLDGGVLRGKGVSAEPGQPETAVFKLNWLSATGTGIFVAVLLSALWMRVSPRRFLRVFFATLMRMRWPLFTIATMLAIAYITRYGGADVTLGLAFTKTGVLYPFFAAMLGWLGVALTGSDTSSNALFGSLQKVTAEGLGLNPVLICAANSTGGVMGKMIDAQSIVVSAAATNQPGGESQILRFVFWHSVILASLMGLLTLLQATVLTWMVPGG
ncbi:MAG: L-lactate permease [Pirellulaceae bacterium]